MYTNIDLFRKGDLECLMKKGREIRENYSGKKIDFCSILSGKTGGCSEDCAFCAQSIHRKTSIEETDLISKEALTDYCDKMQGNIDRFSIVTSGRTLDKEFSELSKYYAWMNRNYSFNLCASHGFLSEGQLEKLKDCGVKRYHCNIETSQSFFSNICSTHDYEEKIDMIKKAQRLGFEICSGGIIGMGESFEDRYEMAMTLKELKVDSVPINILLPQKGTRLEHQKILKKGEILRTLAMFRLLLPETSIRLAAGRGLYPDFEKEILDTGIDALMTGNLLTTTGSDLSKDQKIIDELGYERINHEKY